MKFVVSSPINGEGLEIDLEKGCYFMAAAGPLNDWLEPQQHVQSNTAVDKITLSGVKGDAAMVQPSIAFVFSYITLSILK